MGIYYMGILSGQFWVYENGLRRFWLWTAQPTVKIVLRWNKIHQITSESLIRYDDMPEEDRAQMQVKEPVR